jgi:hypothetical protein
VIALRYMWLSVMLGLDGFSCPNCGVNNLLCPWVGEKREKETDIHASHDVRNRCFNIVETMTFMMTDTILIKIEVAYK